MTLVGGYQGRPIGIRLIGPRPKWARTDGGDGGAHPSNVIEYGYPMGGINFTGGAPERALLRVLEETDSRPRVSYRQGGDDYLLVDHGHGRFDLNHKCRTTALRRRLEAGTGGAVRFAATGGGGRRSAPTGWRGWRRSCWPGGTKRNGPGAFPWTTSRHSCVVSLEKVGDLRARSSNG